MVNSSETLSYTTVTHRELYTKEGKLYTKEEFMSLPRKALTFWQLRVSYGLWIHVLRTPIFSIFSMLTLNTTSKI